MRKGAPCPQNNSVSFDTYELCTVITEHEIVIGDHYSCELKKIELTTITSNVTQKQNWHGTSTHRVPTEILKCWVAIGTLGQTEPDE